MRRRLIVAIVMLPMLELSMPRAVAVDPLVVGLWPQTLAQFHEIQAASGVPLPYFRGRQRDGQFDSQLVPSDAAAAAAAGYSLGLNIQPKTGSGQNRTGIRYTDITAQLQAGSGPHYDKLVGFANEVLALPTYGEVTHYLQFHSEANVQAAPGVLDSQPYSGTGPEYRTSFALVRALFDSMGVTDRIEWQVVLTRGAYDGNHGGPTNWFPDDTSLFDLVGVDGYYRPNSWLTPGESFDSALAFADSVGKPVWIDETGADEGGPNGSAIAKAAWFASLGSYLQAHEGEIAGVVFSHATDGGNWFLDSVSGGRASPHYTGTTWNGWRTLAAAITSPPAPTMRTLTVTPSGDGIGTVAGDVGGIDCGTTCSALVEDGSQVQLTATPSPGSMFVGWSGPGVSCSGTGPCMVSVGADTIVVAMFRALGTLTVASVADTGDGLVESSPAGIECGSSCAASFPLGTEVVLTATPGPDTAVVWSGDCAPAPADADRCTVTVGASSSVVATFVRTVGLSVVRAGAGGGSVSSAPAGLACGSVCSAVFVEGSLVELTATPDLDSTVGWSGPCLVSEADPSVCTVTLQGAVEVTATFVPIVHDLTVVRLGAGGGTVTSTPAGLDCGPSCADAFRQGSAVVLRAEPGPTSVFTGWSDPACPGTGDCTIVIDGPREITASFDLAPRALSASAAGPGTGSITSEPVGIDCGPTCDASFAHGTEVALSAVAGEHSTFTGWSGACSGLGPCVVTMVDATSVVATFALQIHLLTVSAAGPGTGSITSEPAGIACGVACASSFEHGTQVVLTASPDEGMVFSGWSDPVCTGLGPCTIVIDGPREITASFDLAPVPLMISSFGAGSGSVTSQPAGIDCGSTCEASYPPGTSVTLTATPDPDMVFSGWSGACGGLDACTVTLEGATSVGASFEPVRHSLAMTVSGPGSGSVTSLPAGIDCGSTCDASFPHGTQVVLTATPGPTSVFTGWSDPACPGTGDCTIVIDGPRETTASFDLAPVPLMITDADPSVAWNGWRGVTDPVASGGAYRTNAVKGETLTWVSPANTSVSWIARTGPVLGRATVVIDGAGKGTVDLYSSTPGSITKTYGGLGGGAHTVVIKVAGSKNAASTGTTITHDAFVVGATTTQESAPAVRYVSWRSTSQAAATDGSYRSTSTRNATVTVTFSGTAIDWITATGRAYGKASVTIDGVSKGTVDLYTSSTTWQVRRAFGGLSPGDHTAVIKVLGTKNAAATGTDVVVDGFVVQP